MNIDDEAAGLRIRARAGIGIPHGDNEFTRALLAILDEREQMKARIVRLESEQQAALKVLRLDNAPSDRGKMIIASLKALYNQVTRQAKRIRELEASGNPTTTARAVTGTGSGCAVSSPNPGDGIPPAASTGNR